MYATNDKITIRQMILAIIQTQIGVGVLTLPHNIALHAENDSWISTLVAGIITEGIILLMWLLAIRYPNLTLFEIFMEIMGKFIGRILVLCYAVYLMVKGGFILAQYGLIINRWILERTPNWIILLLLLLASAYIAKDSLKSMIRFFVLVLPLIVVLIVLVSYSLKDAKFIYLLPVGASSPIQILNGSQEAIFSMMGFNLLFFIYPFVQGTNKQKLKAVSIAHLFTVAYYTYLVVLSLMYFVSAEDMNHIPESIVYMIKAFSFNVFERMDLFFLSIWVINVATSLMTTIYIACNGFASMFQGKSHRAALPYVCIFIFLLALVLSREDYFDTFSPYFNLSHYIFQFLIPVILLLAAIVWKKQKQKGQISHEAS
ncbi:GerAB/ArcD/ProY family transporter [Paenibacillus albiflavus]|nr:GerAB/ArcD/ProY family transporter [Paenibacillus albiflavus]